MIFNTILRPEDRVRKHLPLYIILLLFAASQAGAEFYSWTDREGREFYTNDQDKVPPAYRDTARPVEVQEERVSRGQGPAGPAPDRNNKVQPQRDQNGRGEKYWRDRAERLRRQLRTHQAERDRLVQKGRDAEQAHTFPTKSDRKARKDRERKLAKIDQKMSRLKHALEVELPEEARKADALPGWIR